MQIGFLGLGIMGAPMAEHLVDAGHQIATVLHRQALSSPLIGRVQVFDAVAALARQCDTIITMLPDTPEVEEVLMGANGVFHNIRPRSLVIDMSTISPIATRRMGALFADAGCDFLDAPVSGGEIGAKSASLTIMVGGTVAGFARALPVFSLLGKNITHVGEQNGAGQVCKLANQIIVGLNIAAVAEALVFASKAGCDPSKVRQALLGGFAGSRVLEVHGERMTKGTFNPGFRLRLHQKDLGLALDAARSFGGCLPGTAQGLQLLNSCVAHGEGEADHSALVRAFERLCDHSIRA